MMHGRAIAAILAAAGCTLLAPPADAQTSADGVHSAPGITAPARSRSGAVMMSWRVVDAREVGHVEVTCPHVLVYTEPNGGRVTQNGRPVALLRGGTAVWHRPAFRDADGKAWYSIGFAGDAVTGVVPAACVREI